MVDDKVFIKNQNFELLWFLKIVERIRISQNKNIKKITFNIVYKCINQMPDQVLTSQMVYDNII